MYLSLAYIGTVDRIEKAGGRTFHERQRIGARGEGTQSSITGLADISRKGADQGRTPAPGADGVACLPSNRRKPLEEATVTARAREAWRGGQGDRWKA